MGKARRHTNLVPPLPTAEWVFAAGSQVVKIQRHALLRWGMRAPGPLRDWRVLVNDYHFSRPVEGHPGYRTLYGVVICMHGPWVATVIAADELMPRLLRRGPASIGSLPRPLKPAA